MSSHEGQKKRPSLASRHSSSSVCFARAPYDELSSSAQRHRPQRHVVGQGRLGPRVPSYGKNVNKLQRAAQPRPTEPIASPKASHIKRNSSELHGNREWSSTNLRKNHSETSLKKNRSSGHLTKLARPAAPRMFAKISHKRPTRAHRSSSTTIHAPQGPPNPTVRFALGHEDEEGPEEDDPGSQEDASWTNESASQSPCTSRSNTRPSSVNASPRRSLESSREIDKGDLPQFQQKVGASARPDTPPTPRSEPCSTLSPDKSPRRSNPSDSNSITSRLLQRNTSFTIAPQLSTISSTPVHSDAHSSHSSSQPTSQSTGHNTLNDNSAPEIVSRFLNVGSSSGPHASSFLPSHPQTPRETSPTGASDPDVLRRNKSSPSIAAHPVSRTQRKLNLEREAIKNEPSNGSRPPIGLLRSSRTSNVNVPFHGVHASSDGTVDPHLRKLFDQTDTEYQRMRAFHNPLGDAIVKLQEAGMAPRGRPVPKPKAGGKGGLLATSTSGSGDGRYGLSQSWRSQRSAMRANGEAVKKQRVSFQGIKGSKDDGELDKPSNMEREDSEQKSKTQRDEVKELCRRLWTSTWEVERPNGAD